MMFGGRSNIVEWSRGEPESRRGQPTDPGEVGRKFFENGCSGIRLVLEKATLRFKSA